MKNEVRKPTSPLRLTLGLLVFAVICLAAHPVLSQQARQECPLPDVVMTSEHLPVTAQQVDDGNASLMAFSLAARERYIALHEDVTTFEGSLQVQCLMRQENNTWHSDETYLVFLTPYGRVFQHAKDMGLSGRTLKPSIYGAILRAVGIDPAVFSGPADALAPAFVSAADGDGGPFDVPDIPGASGYAVVHFDGQLPIIWVSGFKIDETHLIPIADEGIVHADPLVAASEVVDRDTLKTFVEEAWDYMYGIFSTSGLSALSNLRVALRDEDGPWKHDSVYLYMLQRTSNVILFHGAFPNTYEFRPLVPVARDVVTGKLVLPQVLEAATNSPEGGFVEYHFDDPADDTDSANILKVGYAREFIATGRLADGTIREISYIIGSGFYLTPDSEYVRRLLAALKDGQNSIMFGITTPDDGDVVSGDAVDISITGAPTSAVHFAYRLAGLPDEPYTYLGAATKLEGVVSFAWDTLDLRDDDYELVAMYTEDEGRSVVYDSIEVNVDNVGDGGCVAVPVLTGGGPVDPTLPALVGLVLTYLLLGRLRGAGGAAGGEAPGA